MDTRAPRSRRGVAPDVLLALVVAAVGGAGHWLAAGPEASWWGIASVVVGGLSLAARRRLPLLVLAVTAVLVALTYLAGEVHQGPFIILPVLVALYTAAEHGDRRAAVIAAVGVALALLGGLLVATGVVDALGVLWGIGWLAAAVVTGEVVRNRRDYMAAVEARAMEAERTREEEARRRAGEERLRIARDLHDVVAHNLSTINVQAGVAAHLLDSGPEPARSALLAIKQASKDALTELRSTLGVLRETDEPGEGAPREPAPGLARLDALVARTTAAGLPVELSVDGTPKQLPGQVDLAAYRIVQESLTNALRHAGDARATVRLTYGDDTLEVVVDDDGRGTTAGPARHGGHGIAGMRERAAATGGDLDVGPRPGGGFRVRATLSLDGQSS